MTNTLQKVYIFAHLFNPISAEGVMQEHRIVITGEKKTENDINGKILRCVAKYSPNHPPPKKKTNNLNPGI